MYRFYYLVFILQFTFTSCSQEEKQAVAFYHWKNESKLSEIETRALTELACSDIYLRFFDIAVTDQGVIPISVIRDMDSNVKKLHVIPVVYITNETFKSRYNTHTLAVKVSKLIRQMYRHHLDTIPHKIQIDCDWTVETRERYFDFLTTLSSNFEVSATIRLHQIKYASNTGVPPVTEGSLMAYNTGELSDTSSNSIFSLATIKQYINSESTYPLPLDMALPLYAWGVATDGNKTIKLLNNLQASDLRKEKDKFEPIGANIFKTIKPCFLRGLSLSIGTIIECEKVDIEEVIKTQKYLYHCSRIQWKKTILYHLDDEVLNQYNLDELKKLK